MEVLVSSWDNHLFLWAIYTMAMLKITRGYIFKQDAERFWHFDAFRII